MCEDASGGEEDEINTLPALAGQQELRGCGVRSWTPPSRGSAAKVERRMADRGESG